MATESLLEPLIENLADALREMTEGNGYWFNYGPVIVDSRVSFETEPDEFHPSIGVWWDGTVAAEDVGNEQATRRSRHLERIFVEVCVKGTDRTSVGLLLRRVRQDIHKAVMEDRSRGSSRVNTFDASQVEIDYAVENQSRYGKILYLFLIRWDHLTGDMTSQ